MMNGTPKRGRGKTREMVKRLYLEGRTIREIASRTGVSVQMVAAHVRSLVDAGEVRPRRKSA